MSIKEPIIQKRAELYDIIRNNPNVERDHGIYLDFKIYDMLFFCISFASSSNSKFGP